MKPAGTFVLVMGVSGVGKSTIAAAIARELGGRFLDADAYHSPENIAAMRAGHPLTDEMRAGWLDAVGAGAQRVAEQQGTPVVIACSALKKSYRARLRRALGEMFVVFLDGARDTIFARMQARSAHFMPASLLESQLATLEPWADEPDAGLHLDVAAPVEALVSASCVAYRRASAGHRE